MNKTDFLYYFYYYFISKTVFGPMNTHVQSGCNKAAVTKWLQHYHALLCPGAEISNTVTKSVNESVRDIDCS